MDPGIVHTSSCEGSIDAAEVTPDMNLKNLLPAWWRSDVAGKIDPLYLAELKEDGAVFRYAAREFFVPFGDGRRVDKVGLSYAYGELHVSIEKTE